MTLYRKENIQKWFLNSSSAGSWVEMFACLLIFAVLRIKHRASCMPGKYYINELQSQFKMFYSEMKKIRS
jgi:hypothetical protein